MVNHQKCNDAVLQFKQNTIFQKWLFHLQDKAFSIKIIKLIHKMF